MTAWGFPGVKVRRNGYFEEDYYSAYVCAGLSSETRVGCNPETILVKA